VLEAPVTRYTDCEGISIAYQVLGTGDLDLIFVPGGVSHVDVTWQQDRAYRRMMERLTSFARVVVFDKRGMGASDPVLTPPTLEERTADIRAVMDAVGIDRAAVLGLSEGGSSCAARSPPAEPSPTRSPTTRWTPSAPSGRTRSSGGRLAWARG
jgi:pimeloyl-ACP methyl ester carboxylesterase